MSVGIDLDPDAEAAIKAYAASASMDAERYGSRWVNVLARHPELGRNLGEAHGQGKRDAIFARAIQIEAFGNDIEAFGRRHKLPSLPDEALTRETIYQDHD